ncbi:Uncharacterized protein OS=Xanthomonas perforans 91-118 GN=XPE_2373 PE=4 SV=1: SUFU [Gemmata massiliana]|uniref:Suppressor of fused-like domain-containing protein n=1 Tax=Gemmata massiliana TaxID=1210884 RepID=A0A6P2CWA1_9BACT|nr:hypothetical protein [Gemmata massiliana]VTR93173.1 Uncharacterized protein OS=Xanthomonas perforans 91-118 GN=XPE_2373 PE=4 SV=1: SUFU [Gemmata massiliana]
MLDEDLFERTCQARDAFFRSLGEVEDLIWGPIVPPDARGPHWPARRQGWRRVFRGANALYLSEGLSDPFDNRPEPNQGFGLEVLVETPDSFPGPVPGGWPFRVAYELAQLAADYGQVRERLLEEPLLSTDLEAFAPEMQSLADSRGRFGVILGVPAPWVPPTVALPAGDILIVTVKVLTFDEYAHAWEHGAAGRRTLAERFAEQGTHHVSSLARPSVI